MLKLSDFLKFFEATYTKLKHLETAIKLLHLEQFVKKDIKKSKHFCDIRLMKLLRF